jgi:tetratricopeptide (TPR) repeat protein
MRILFFLLLLIITGVHPVFGQVPSQKEIQAQMQSAIDELSKQVTDLEKQIADQEKLIADAKKNKKDPDTVSSMEEELNQLKQQLAMLKKQLAMMGGLSKSIDKMPKRIVKQAIEKDSIEQLQIVSVPKLDKKRIALIPKETLNDSQLTVFVRKVHAEVEKLIPKEDKEEASKIYAAAKKLNKSSNAINNIASNLWASGQPEQALYVLGQECAANPNNGNNLNNYAAFLTMAGGEQAAIPILQNLDNKYSGNSTITNNIGQAWYALGEMNKAKQELDKTIAIYKNHPQANQTKAWILKSEGKDKEAIEALKRSIQEVYTTEKDHLLDKLGYKLKFRDFSFPYPGKPGNTPNPVVEQLGIDKFIRALPAYPFEGGNTAETSYNEWYNFRLKVNAASQIVDAKILALEPMVQAHNQRIVADPKLLEPYNNHIHITARRKLMVLAEWLVDRMLEIDKEYKSAADSIALWKEEFNNAVKGVEACGPRKDAATKFLLKANTRYQQINTQYINMLKGYYNTMARLVLYTSTDPAEYQFQIESIKRGVLSALQGLPCEFEVGCVPASTQQQGQSRALPDFDSLTCQYKDEIYIPPFTVIKTECNIMTTTIDVGTETLFKAFELKMSLGMVENLNSGKITKGTLEIGVEAGVVSGNIGPIKGEIKGGIGAGIEITSDGVKEVYIKTSATAELTGHIDEPDPRFLQEGIMDSKGSTIGGLDAKISWNAGPKGDWGFQHSNTSGSVSHFLNGILGPK